MGLKDLQIFAQEEAERANQSQAVNQSLTRGLDENPDEYAKLLKISAQTGIAPSLAKDFRPELEKRQKLQSLSVDDLVRSNPKTAKFLANPDNAAVAQDDVQNLSVLEQVLIKPIDYTRSAAEGVVGKGAGSLLSGAGELYGVASRSLESLLDKALPNSVMSVLRTPVPWFMDPAQVLKRPGQTLKQAGEYIAPPKERQGLDTDVASGIGQLGFQIASYLATGGAISSASLYAQGADVVATKTAKDKGTGPLADVLGMTPGTARDTAIVGGAIITKITEQYGLDKILNRVPPEIKNRTLRFIADKVAAGGIEAGQEIVEGLLHDLTRKVLTEENAPILEGALKEGTAAALSAAIVRSALGVRGYREAKQQEEVVKALSGDSKLRDRLPEKYQEFVAGVTENGPVQNAYIPVEQFNTFFQSQGVDPEQVAGEIGASNYLEALAAGSEVVIPIDKFAANVAPTDYLQGLIPDLKFNQGSMTPRQRQAYMAEMDAREAELESQMQALVDEQTRQGGINQAIQEIVTDIEGQLRGAGYDASTAQSSATVMRGMAILAERDLRGRAQAEGREVTDEEIVTAARALWDKYGLTTGRQMPGVLATRPTSDITIDPLLDSLRAGAFPTDQQIFGRSLAEFVRDSGGLQPSGETLTADENMERRPFQKKLTQKDGMSLDKALEAAVQAGYFPGVTPGEMTEADFLNALDDDLRGSGVFSINVTDNNALAMREAMNQLSDYLDSLGIDLRALDNRQVRALIEQARNTPELEGVVGQLDQLYQRVLAGEIRTLPEQIEVDGVMRPTTNNLGQQIHPTQEGVVNFWRWFGESKVVDEQGKPMVVYHTTRYTGDDGRGIDVLKSSAQLKREGKTSIGYTEGIYFTSDPEYSASYGRGQEGANTIPVYLSLQNPKIIERKAPSRGFFDALRNQSDDESDVFSSAAVSAKELQDLKDQGHDGIINKELDEIVVFDPTQIKSATGNDGMFDPANDNILFQSATLRSGKETLKKYGLKPDGKYKTREVAAALEARQRAKYGLIAADDRSPEAMANIAKWMAAEVEFEMANPEKSGVGWYSEKFQRALDIMANAFPELKTDKLARNTMTALIAITSDGQKVMPNFAQAMDIYGNFRAGGATEGQFTTTRGHQRQASIDANLKVIQRLHDMMGPEAMHEYLMQEKTISELKKIAKANGGELKSDYQAHIRMPMAAVEFGPKLGAFYANLMGAHGYLTMDRWWSRSFNRYRGTLLQAPTKEGVARIKELMGHPEWSDDEAIAATVEPRNSYEAKNFKNGTEIEKAANTVYKAAFENLEDAPFNATDRTFMLDAVNKAQKSLARKGYNLSVADIQAILWYYEKRLYGELGARQTADISYEEAASRVVAGYVAGSGVEPVLDDAEAAREDGGADQGRVPLGEEQFNAEGVSTLYQGVDQTQKPGFNAWSNGHPVVRMGDGHTFRSGDGVVVESIHATTGDFDTFDRRKGNIESDLGAGFYSTNNTADAAANYAGMGPDLTIKIEREAERLVYDLEEEMPDASQDEIQAEAERRAREKFMANEGLTMPVFVRFDNPVVLGGDGETFLDYEEAYDEEADEYGEPTGKLVDLVMAVRELGDEGEFEMDTETAVDALMQDAMDNGGLKASEAIDSLKKALVYAVDYETGDSATNEIVRQAFERAGFDGFIDTTVNKKFGSEKRVGKAMEGMDSGTVHFIAFKPDQMASRTGSTWERGDVGDSILRQGNELDDKRGFIQFGANRKFNITLLEKANLSTFLHESGHFYLEVLGDLATAEGAPEQIRNDYATTLKFLGLESREQLTLDGKEKGSAEYNRAVEAHEKFARGFEAYLMEGNAPSPELQGIFQSFKSWLVMVYKQISALNVTLNNDVRGVFDRILASDAEIEAAKNEVNVQALLLDAAAAGMSSQEFELYRDSVAKATEAGKEALTAKLMRQFMRERKEWWKEASAKMREEVTLEVDSQPVYQAFKALVAGKMDDDTEIKLNKQSLIDKYGAEYVKRLPRGFARIYSAQGGMDADTAAEFLGYNSGDALIEALVGMRDRKELIAAETDLRMREVHGDLMTDGTIADEAKIALHNAQRENVLMTELRALRRKQREVAPFVQAERDKARQDRRNARAATEVPPAEAFRRVASGIIGQTSVRDTNPNSYLLASRKAARQAFEAMSKGDYMLAADAKQKELLNHYLYLEANKAKERQEKILKYAQKFEKGTTREQMGKAGGTYLEQIDAVLDRYEFRRVPLSKLDRRASLAEWIAEQEALGMEPAISAELLNESRRVNYRQISNDELNAVYDTVRNIEHLARLKNKLKTKQAEIEFADAIAELVAAAENMTAGKSGKAVGERKPLPLDMSAMTMREKAGDQVSRLDAMLLKMEQVVEWLDNGNVNGPWHTYLWNPIAEAQNAEYDLTRKLTERLATSLEAMPKERRMAMLDTFEIPGMGKVTRKYLISIAMNMGNQGNIDKMMRGMGWDMATIERGLAKLDDADWTFVQETWDTINSVWPEIAALEKRMTGIEPPKVEAQPYEVRDEQGNVTRTLAGGYYPLVYDPRLSEQGAKQESGNLGQLFEEGYVRATTPKGHTQARMEGFAAPMLLDFEQVVTQHMAKVVKDLTHREAVVMANKILTNREIRSVLQETLGPAYEKQMLPWLRSVVNDRNGGSAQGLADFSRWMMTARANIVAATMGFKATTMIAQITGISQSLDKVKGRYIGEALLMYLRHPIALTREVRELSGEMRNRANTLDRDIRDQLRNLTGQNSKWAQAQRFAFHGIAIADAMVTVPTWMGAYRQALDSGADEATARLEADAAVRMTQGGGGAKDLAAIQRNNELAKAVTMFYSYFSVLYNRMRDMGRDVQEIRDMPRFLSRVFFTIAVPAVLGELILGRGPDDDEEPEAWAARKVLLYPLMSVPVIRDVASAIDSGYDYRFSPMASVFDKIGKAATSTGKLIEGDIEWDAYALRVTETIGYVFGVAGTAQMAATGKYLWRVSEGEENPDNIAELLAYALLGKRKED